MCDRTLLVEGVHKLHVFILHYPEHEKYQATACLHTTQYAKHTYLRIHFCKLIVQYSQVLSKCRDIHILFSSTNCNKRACHQLKVAGLSTFQQFLHTYPSNFFNSTNNTKVYEANATIAHHQQITYANNKNAVKSPCT